MPDNKPNYGGFPLTRNSAILALKQSDPNSRRAALNQIIALYWPPVYRYLRLRWNKDSDTAADLTQGFFLNALEKEFLADFDPQKARFRTFIRLCLDRYVAKQIESATRQKRGGDFEHLSLDFAAIERELAKSTAAHSLNPEELFDQEWIRNLFSSAVEKLKLDYERSGKNIHFAIFEGYDLQSLDSDEKSSYQELADRHSITVETVTNYLSAARRDFRKIVLELLRDLCGSDEEYRDEVRSILGVEP